MKKLILIIFLFTWAYSFAQTGTITPQFRGQTTQTAHLDPLIYTYVGKSGGYDSLYTKYYIDRYFLSKINANGLFIQNQSSVEQAASAWISGNLKIDFQQPDVALGVDNGTGTAANIRGYVFFGNHVGGSSDVEFQINSQVDAGYKMRLLDYPVGQYDAVNLGYLNQFYAGQSSGNSYFQNKGGGSYIFNNSAGNQQNLVLSDNGNLLARGVITENGIPVNSNDVVNLAYFNNTPSFGYGLNSNGPITLTATGGGGSVLYGDTWTGNANQYYSSIQLGFEIGLHPGYEGIYANDYTSNTELFHFGVPNEADEISRIDENFELNFTVPNFPYNYDQGQVLIKDGTYGAFSQLPITDFGLNIASGDFTAQTAANTSVATYLVPNGITLKGVLNIQGYMNIASISGDVIEMQVNYTDENNNAQTLNMYNSGATSPLINATGPSQFPPILIKAKLNTNITISTILITATGSINYDCGATIQLVR